MPSPFARSAAPAGLPPADPFAAPAPAAKSVPPGTMPAARRSAPPAQQFASSDPFAAAQPVAAAQEVRIVFDDKAVSDLEIGRKGNSKIVYAAVAAALVGLAAGWMGGATTDRRAQYNVVLQDTKEIYSTVTNAAPIVEKTQKLLDQAVRSAGGQNPTIDTKALEELRKLQKPFEADAFSRKKYGALEAGTVDALFTYYNNVNLLWMKLQSLTARGLNPANREQLERAAKAAGLEYGCVPFGEGENWGCGLVTLVAAPDGKTKVMLRGASYDKTPFAGQELGTKASDFVIRVDRARSAEVLGQTTSLFTSYVRDLVESKTLVDQTLEVQGRLIQALGTVAKLEGL